MKYSVSFTAGSLFINETQKVASVYLQYHDWDKVRDKILSDNVLQKATTGTAVREFNEIRKRLKNLSNDVINKLSTAGAGTKKILVFYSVIKEYRILFDFLREVIRPKVLVFDFQLADKDLDKFIRRKAESVPELERIADSTRQKIKQVIIRMLNEADLIDSIKTKNLLPLKLPENIISLIIKDDPVYLEAFLLPDLDIKYYKEKYKINVK